MDKTAAGCGSPSPEGVIVQTDALPKLYKPGRVKGTREMVVRPNYVVVYREDSRAVTILRVLHAARQWPK